MGMSAEEFWHGDLRLCEAYRKAARIRRSNALEAEWRAGVYVFEALVSASNAYREFGKGVEHEYPQAPVFTLRGTAEEDAAADKRHMERMRARVETFAARFNSRFDDGE